MLDLCSENQLYILIGRTLGDFNGNFTCNTLRGSSVVYYFIASTSLSINIFNLFVHNLSIFLDHCLKLEINKCNNTGDEKSIYSEETNVKYSQIPDTFMWTEKNRVSYQKAQNFLETQYKLKGIDKQLGYDNVDIKSIVDQITKIMLLAGNKSLIRRSFRMKNKKYT